MSARNWDRAIALKLGAGLLISTFVAPVVAIIADRARVTRNARRWAK